MASRRLLNMLWRNSLKSSAPKSPITAVPSSSFQRQQSGMPHVDCEWELCPERHLKIRPDAKLVLSSASFAC